MDKPSLASAVIVHLLPMLIVFTGGCHKLFPYPKLEGSDLGPGGQADGQSRIDSSISDDANLTGSPDQMPPDLLAPDTWPPFGGPCNKLWVDPSPTGVQISDTNGSIEASSPSITAVGDTFFVAFGEGDAVHVRRIDGYGYSLGKIVTISATGEVGRSPWITASGSGSGARLGVVWQTGQTGSMPKWCLNDVVFWELDQQLTQGTSCVLSYSGLDHAHPSLSSNATEYVMAVPIVFSGCSNHIKPFARRFSVTSTCSTGSWGYSNFGTATSTWYPVMIWTGNTSQPLAMVRLRHSENPGTSAYPIDVNLHTTDSQYTWQAEQTLTSAAAKNRPSLAARSTGLWVSWTTSTYSIKVLDIPFSGATTTDTTVPSAMDPFLTHKTHQDTDDASVLVYTHLVASATGPDAGSSVSPDAGASAFSPDAIKLKPLSGAISSLQDLTIRSEPASSTSPVDPRTPVVAAGSSGFGVAWVDDSQGQPEVFFKWVGCLP